MVKQTSSFLNYKSLEESGYKFFGGKPKAKIQEKATRKPEKQTLSQKFNKVLVKEDVASHKDSIVTLSDQIAKFLSKHKSNPNAACNDFAIGLFLGFSEWFAKDGDAKTDGIKMLSRTIEKIKALSKSYADLIPEPEEDFDVDDAADEMEDEIDDDDGPEEIPDTDLDDAEDLDSDVSDYEMNEDTEADEDTELDEAVIPDEGEPHEDPEPKENDEPATGDAALAMEAADDEDYEKAMQLDESQSPLSREDGKENLTESERTKLKRLESIYNGI